MSAMQELNEAMLYRIMYEQFMNQVWEKTNRRLGKQRPNVESEFKAAENQINKAQSRIDRYFLNRSLLTMLTRTSVHCAERIVAIKSSSGLLCVSAVPAPG